MREIKNELTQILKSLFNERGLPVAAGGDNYQFCWIRDSYYILRVFKDSEPELYKKGYESLCEYFNGLNSKYDNKIDLLIKNGRKNVNRIEFAHSRFDPNTLEEIPCEFMNVQIDSLGYLLLGIAEGWDKCIKIEGSEKVVNTIIDILKSIRYWDCPDSGIWEENEEVHASSIGAVVGGLEAIGKYLPERENDLYMLIGKGCSALRALLPRESITKPNDLALATIACYPFNVLSPSMSEEIVNNIHSNLEYEYGAIRYQGDTYYMKDGVEMQWTLWLGFCGIYYFNVGKKATAKKYLEKLINLHFTNGRKGIAEGYTNGKPNDNNPLGWSIASMIELINLFEK